jgi:hypothetical protein
LPEQGKDFRDRHHVLEKLGFWITDDKRIAANIVARSM